MKLTSTIKRSPGFLMNNLNKMNMNINESREYKAAKELERVLNDYSFNPDRFTAAIPSFHKTLEQNFMRLIIACIKFMADDSNRFIDLRNKGSHEAAVILAKALEDHKDEIYLPFI